MGIREGLKPWRRVVTLHLPGDEDINLRNLIYAAAKRDGRLNQEEWKARATGAMCSYLARELPQHQCSYRHPGWKCYECQELN